MHKKLIRAPKTIKQAATDVDLESAINDTHTHTNSANLREVGAQLINVAIKHPLFPLQIFPPPPGVEVWNNLRVYSI